MSNYWANGNQWTSVEKHISSLIRKSFFESKDLCDFGKFEQGIKPEYQRSYLSVTFRSIFQNRDKSKATLVKDIIYWNKHVVL